MSMLEAITLMQSSEWLHSRLLEVPPIRRSIEVPSIEEASDGYVGISMVTGQQWLDFAAMVDCAELTEIPDLRFQIGRWDYRDWIRERIGPWMRERTVDEIVELGQLFRLPIAPLGNGAGVQSAAPPRQVAAVRRGDGLRLRLDRPMVGPTGNRVHAAGLVRVDRFSRRSGRPADLDRR